MINTRRFEYNYLVCYSSRLQLTTVLIESLTITRYPNRSIHPQGEEIQLIDLSKGEVQLIDESEKKMINESIKRGEFKRQVNDVFFH